jgi:hypothetical protein
LTAPSESAKHRPSFYHVQTTNLGGRLRIWRGWLQRRRTNLPIKALCHIDGAPVVGIEVAQDCPFASGIASSAE